MNGILITKDQGGRDMIHSRDRGNTALKYLTSSEGKGERSEVLP